MGELVLEDRLLNHHANSTLHEFMPIIDNIQIMIAKNPDSKEMRNLAEKTISVYGGIYKSIQEKTNADKLRNNGSESFFKLLATYVACEGTKQLLKNGSETDISLSIVDGYSANSYYVDVSRSDNAALADTFRIIADSLNYTTNTRTAKSSVINTLDKISQVTANRIFSSPNSIKNYMSLNFTGKNFEVKPPSNEPNKNKSESIEKDQYTKGLQDYIAEKVKSDDIVANEEPKKLLEIISPCLLHYDATTKTNPLGDFPQIIILAGPPGTGKTMLANYFITITEQDAKNSGLNLGVSKSNYESIMQMGPLINIRNQLTTLSSGDMARILFMDEMDKKFIQESNPKEYMEQVNGEILRFRGGSDYPNYKNYVIIGTTNSPERIHKGIIDVSKLIEVEGPRNTSERMKILEINLKKGLDVGYVKIDDSGWNKIREEIDKYELSGRNMKNIATNAFNNYLGIGKIIPRGIGSEAVNNKIKEFVKDINSPYVTTYKDVIKSIRNESEKMKSVHAYV